MANRTVKEAHTVKGTNPQFLVEKIIRSRIYDSKYWKEHCFALTAELIVDKGMELRYVGGVYAGNVKITPFLCLLLKMLQIQPEKDIAVEFIKQDDFKYLRALGAIYIRLTLPSMEIYRLLEPLFNDYRKLRHMDKNGKFSILHMDEFIDNLLREERYCDIQLPRLQKREALELVNELDPYKSLLDEDLDRVSESESDTDDERERRRERPKLVSRRRDRSRERERAERERGRRSASRERERGGDSRRRRTPERKERDRRERGDGRDGRDKERNREREGRGKDDRRSGKDGRKRGARDSEERFIDSQDAMRAKLGLAPLER